MGEREDRAEIFGQDIDQQAARDGAPQVPHPFPSVFSILLTEAEVKDFISSGILSIFDLH